MTTQLGLWREQARADLDDVAVHAIARRHELAATIRGRLGIDDRARFDRRLARLDSFVAVREARAR